MKKLSKTLSAIMAATVIFGTMAMPVSADKLKVTDGITYRYDDDSNLIGEFSGWAKTDGVSRRYVDGKPYTGWLKNNDGTYKYVLDGYIVKGEMLIKNKVYNFDENGIMTRWKKADIIAKRDETAGLSPITVEAQATHLGEFSMGEAEKLERWENGEWVDCLGVDEYLVKDVENLLYYTDCEIDVNIMFFEPKEYIGGDITAGTYRLTFPASEHKSNGERNYFYVYCIFNVSGNFDC